MGILGNLFTGLNGLLGGIGTGVSGIVSSLVGALFGGGGAG